MKMIALTAMVFLIGLAQSGSVQADEEAPRAKFCEKEILGTDQYCQFNCPDSWYIEWTGTTVTSLHGFATCAGVVTETCFVAVTNSPCTKGAGPVSEEDDNGKCYGTGEGLVACRAVNPASLG